MSAIILPGGGPVLARREGGVSARVTSLAKYEIAEKHRRRLEELRADGWVGLLFFQEHHDLHRVGYVCTGRRGVGWAITPAGRLALAWLEGRYPPPPVIPVIRGKFVCRRAA